MTYLGLYEMFSFFSPFCYQILCFSMSNYLNEIKKKIMKCFFPSEILCCVYAFYWLSDEGITLMKIKHLNVGQIKGTVKIN